jgi:CRP/FNR family transcriptional regulator, anaerobic regulatory protein
MDDICLRLTARESIQAYCSKCKVRELCMPANLGIGDLTRLDEVVLSRRKVKQGERLFNQGDAFTSLYAIYSGFLKTSVSSESGREQIIGFQMTGETLGMDGIYNDKHSCDATALEDTEVCVIPYANLEVMSRKIPLLQRHVHNLMSYEIVRENGIMLLLGNMRAEERLAFFLLNLLKRLHVRGFSESELILRMSREEIGSYLGLKLETVSRTFSKFNDEGILEVHMRHVRIIDSIALQKVFTP